jgi:hypothetical protein
MASRISRSASSRIDCFDIGSYLILIADGGLISPQMRRASKRVRSR